MTGGTEVSRASEASEGLACELLLPGRHFQQPKAPNAAGKALTEVAQRKRPPSVGSAYAGYSLMREYINHLVLQCHS